WTKRTSSPSPSVQSSRQTSEKKPRSSPKRRGRISSRPSSSSDRTSGTLMFARAAPEVIGIIGGAEPLGAPHQIVRRQVTELECDLFETHDLEALPLLDCSDE